MNTMLALGLRLAAIGCAMLPFTLHAQIVGGASGSIDLYMFTHLNEDPQTPLTVMESTPLGLVDQSRSIDMSVYGYAEGRSDIDYNYYLHNPASADFDFYASAMSVEGTGYTRADLVLDIVLDAPVKYRIDADINTGWLGSYSISFNGKAGTAYWDELSAAGGTFPLIYSGEAAYGWHPYADEGILPAGQYQLSINTLAVTGRYSDPGLFEATASLHVQLLGDVNLDGFVGLADLGAVLDDWNKAAPAGGSLLGDLDGDGFAGIADLNMVLSAWNADVRPVPPATVAPEPASMLMLLPTTLAIGRRTVTR